MKASEIILTVLAVSMIILSVVNIYLIREQIENNLRALDLLGKLFKEKYGDYPLPENREALNHSWVRESLDQGWTPETREVESLRRMMEDDYFDEWLKKQKEYIEYTHCVFYNKDPKETAYCDYKQEYLDNGCGKGCEYCRRIEEIREMVKEQEHG